MSALQPGSALTPETALSLQDGDAMRDEYGQAFIFRSRLDRDTLSVQRPDGDQSRYIVAQVNGLTYIGSPDADGWMPWTGEKNPLPGLQVDVENNKGSIFRGLAADSLDWSRPGRDGDIVRWRPARLARPSIPLLEMLSYLRAEEGDSITLNCDNPDPRGPNNAVDCCGGWTDWVDRRFSGESLEGAVRAAFEGKKEAERKAGAEAAGLEPDTTGFVLVPAERIAVAKNLIRLYPHKAEAVLVELLMLPRHEGGGRP